MYVIFQKCNLFALNIAKEFTFWIFRTLEDFDILKLVKKFNIIHEHQLMNRALDECPWAMQDNTNLCDLNLIRRTIASMTYM